MRLSLVVLSLLVSVLSLPAQTPEAHVPPRALPVNPADTNDASAVAPAPDVAAATNSAPQAVAGGVNIHWYGHGFVYLVSSVGVRAVFDPFGQGTVHYEFPPHLAADFVLVTHEADDHAAAEQIFGNPLIFRSVTAVGLNRANGIPFHGVSLQKDASGAGGANTAFTIKFDGVQFGYLGQVSAPLLPTEKELLGHVDVLFLPVGLNTLTVAQLNQIVIDLGARVVIPVNYQTPRSGDLVLRSLSDYLADTKFPVRKFDTSEIVITSDSLPTEPTVYALKSP